MVPLVGILATIGVVALVPATELASRVLLGLRLERSLGDLRTSEMSAAHEITLSVTEGSEEFAMHREEPDTEHEKVPA